MTRKEAIDKYVDKFGGWPFFLMMGTSDEYVVQQVEKALETGEEIEPVEGRVY